MKTLLECINQTIEEMTDYMNYNIANTKEKQIKYEPNTRESLFRRVFKKTGKKMQNVPKEIGPESYTQRIKKANETLISANKNNMVSGNKISPLLKINKK